MEPYCTIPFEELNGKRYYYLYLLRADGTIGGREVVVAPQDQIAIEAGHERLATSDFPAGEIWELGRFVIALASRGIGPSVRKSS